MRRKAIDGGNLPQPPAILPHPRGAWPRRLAVATAVATFLLLLVGGLVNPTGSSLACPDWPLCYGSPFPPMVGGIFYEHSHRLFATGVGILTVVLAVLLWRGGRR